MDLAWPKTERRKFKNPESNHGVLRYRRFKKVMQHVNQFTFGTNGLNNMGWIRIPMDPELLPVSGTKKIQSWIRIRINHSGSTTLQLPQTPKAVWWSLCGRVGWCNAAACGQTGSGHWGPRRVATTSEPSRAEHRCGDPGRWCAEEWSLKRKICAEIITLSERVSAFILTYQLATKQI